MNKHVLALSTALSILAFTPAFAQESAPAPASPTVDCTQQANKNDPACANQTQNQSGTTTTTTDQNAQGTTGTDQNAQGTTTTTTTDQNAQTGTTGTQGTDTGTGSTVTTTSQTTGTTTQQTGELIVPADRLNGVQVMSANDYIGKTVYDQGGNNIGEVNDLIISNDGQIQAVILGVGGFLGIGEKDVAVNTSAIQMVQDGDNTRLVVQATKEALESAPSYDKSNRRYATDSTTTTTTTTDQTGSTTAPAGTVDCSVAANANDPACANKTQTQQ